MFLKSERHNLSVLSIVQKSTEYKYIIMYIFLQFMFTVVPVWSKIRDLFVPRINLTVNPLDDPVLWTSFASIVVKTSCNLGLLCNFRNYIRVKQVLFDDIGYYFRYNRKFETFLLLNYIIYS